MRSIDTFVPKQSYTDVVMTLTHIKYCQCGQYADTHGNDGNPKLGQHSDTSVLAIVLSR